MNIFILSTDNNLKPIELEYTIGDCNFLFDCIAPARAVINNKQKYVLLHFDDDGKVSDIEYVTEDEAEEMRLA